MGFFNFKKNKSKYDEFLSLCESLIVNNEIKTIPSCKDDLIDAVKQMTAGAKAQINNGLLPSVMYEEFAYKMIANCSFELLASGRYHIYRGQLNPMSCADNLMKMHNISIEYGLKKGMITEKQQKEDYEYLIESIQNVG